jgi:hypothetical protein
MLRKKQGKKISSAYVLSAGILYTLPYLIQQRQGLVHFLKLIGLWVKKTAWQHGLTL